MKYFREASSDQQYWIRVERWNKHDDNTLLAFLEVDPKLIMGEIHAFRNRNRHFLAAISSLQRISGVSTPEEKLAIILAMFRDITTSSTSVTWSMVSTCLDAQNFPSWHMI